jgi:molecular chaperone DnaJ
VHVEPHPIFERSPNGDLTLTVPVTFVEAALGAKVDVPTLDGAVTVRVPPGSSSGKVLRVRGRGAPRPKGGPSDLLVRLVVEVPKKLSRKEKEILQQFAESHHESPRRHLESHLRAASQQAS